MSRYPSIAPGLLAGGEIFDALPDAWLVLDGDAQVVAVNRAYLKLLASEREAVIGRSVYDINQVGSREQREERRRWLHAVLAHLGPGEARLSPPIRYDLDPHGDGRMQTRYWQVRARLLDAGGDRRLYGLCVLDITDGMEAAGRDQRERAKLRSQARLRQVLVEEATAQLRTQQERFQQALAFANVGAIELETATGELMCNMQFKALLGIEPDAVLTKTRFFEESIDEAHRARVQEAFDETLRTGTPIEVDFLVTLPGGAPRWILLRAAGQAHRDGVGASIAGLALDITARKESELQHVAIAQAERQARRQSEEATRAMDHFVTAVSHELRSPLGAILSWATLLQRTSDTGHMMRAGTVIERNARQLALMVDDLLDSGAIATGKLSVQLAPVDLGALTGNVAEDMRVSVEAKGLRLTADDLTSCIVMADEARIRQVIWNLLTNATKFCVEGRVTVAVQVDGGEARVMVRDTGRGIAAEALERIFERFHQEDRDGRASGLGLGLWLARNIVQLHGGTITAESEGRGCGATFWIRLPLYR